MTTPFQKAHLAAFALNNIGISLLQCRSCKKSIEALGYALTVVKDLVKCSSEEQGEVVHRQSPLSQGYLETLVDSASKDLASVTSARHDESVRDSNPEVCTLVSYNSIVAFQASMQEPSMLLSSPAILIRIELEGKTLQECDHEDPNLIAAIVLYNLANAYKYLAATDDEIDSTSHLQCAFKLLRLSYSVLDNHCRNDTDEQITDICIPLVILVLQSLVSCANLLGRVGEESNLADYIHFLQEHLHQQKVLYSCNTAAAAA